jgi:two-component system, cell cycle sensor histidine kinase and response regulator CckA
MSKSRTNPSPSTEESLRLLARIGEMKDELDRLRGSTPPAKAAFPQHEFELQYKEIFDNISVCMFLLDVTPEGRFRIVGFNPAEQEAVGLTNDEVAGRFIEEVFPADLAAKVTASYRRCLAANAPIRYEDALDLPHGRRCFYTNLIPVRNAAGSIHRIIGACIETTDFRRTQEETLARQKLESLGVVARGIAHDFNNLLGSILAEAELAQSEMSLRVMPVQQVETIKGVTIRAAELVRELMIYSGQDDTNFEPLGLSQLVKEMLHLLKASISKHAVLNADLPEDLPLVNANPAQIRQVVMNLITNASEALQDKQGVISISTAHVRPGNSAPARALHLPKGEYVRFTVTDTGCGMTEDIRIRIFDPFFTTKFAGRGLGLSGVQGIVHSHGGAIRVASAPGRGSRFEMFLPCIHQPQPDNPPAGSVSSAGDAAAAAATPACGTVLIVEDEDVLRAATSKMLRKTGFTVIEAGDGTTGVTLFQANRGKVDVVLLDMTLPGICGPEVVEELRRIQPDIKVVLTTAYSRDLTVTAFGGQQFRHFIRKPYRLRELIDLLRNVIAGTTD